MTIPPDEVEYPIMTCPQCGNQYELRELDIETSKKPPKYYCPNCGTLVFEPEVE